MRAQRTVISPGQKYGRLTVISCAGLYKRYNWWKCRCDCGNEKTVRSSRLTSGNTVSCGCYRTEVNTAKAVLLGFNSATHGHTRGHKYTPEYLSWYAMRQRVNNKNHEHYPYYGGRGIKICKRWEKFANFLADMGPRPKGHTLDRKDTNGNYEPKNCKWSTWKEQQNNRRPRRKMLTCRKGHERNEKNSYKTKTGAFICRVCKNERRRINHGT